MYELVPTTSEENFVLFEVLSHKWLHSGFKDMFFMILWIDFKINSIVFAFQVNPFETFIKVVKKLISINEIALDTWLLQFIYLYVLYDSFE